MIYKLTPDLYLMQGSIHFSEILKVKIWKILRRLRTFFMNEKQWIIVLEIFQVLNDLKSIDPP